MINPSHFCLSWRIKKYWQSIYRWKEKLKILSNGVGSVEDTVWINFKEESKKCREVIWDQNEECA